MTELEKLLFNALNELAQYAGVEMKQPSVWFIKVHQRKFVALGLLDMEGQFNQQEYNKLVCETLRKEKK